MYQAQVGITVDQGEEETDHRDDFEAENGSEVKKES
jgi:hypothetical protein